MAADIDIEGSAAKEYDADKMAAGLWKAVDSLEEKQAEVVRYRFRNNMTLKEAGAMLGVNTERTRQIQSKAMRELRKQFDRTWMSEVEKEVFYRLGL